jgi:hypothetical protein
MVINPKEMNKVLPGSKVVVLATANDITDTSGSYLKAIVKAVGKNNTQIVVPPSIKELNLKVKIDNLFGKTVNRFSNIVIV